MEKLNYHHIPITREKGRAALQWAKSRILAEPRRFDMQEWISNERTDTRTLSRDLRNLLQPPCNTVACLAGHLCFSDSKFDWHRQNIPDFAMKLLGVEGDRKRVRIIRSSLFNQNSWPSEFFVRYVSHPYCLEHLQNNAAVVGEYIDYILEYGVPDTHGEDPS